MTMSCINRKLTPSFIKNELPTKQKINKPVLRLTSKVTPVEQPTYKEVIIKPKSRKLNH